MAKSKHFRKDVITARIIFAALCILLIAGIIFVSSLFGSSDEKEDSQSTESQVTESQQNDNWQQSEITSEDTESENTEAEEPVDDGEVVYYVQTTTQLRLRAEPNTDCEVLADIPAWNKAVLIEELDGWYYVEYNGQEGYLSADYSVIVEE